MTDDPARRVRELVRSLDRAALATAFRRDGETWPFASLVLTAVDHDLSPILLISDLAVHSAAIATDDRGSLLFDGTGGLDQPLTGPRVTVVGRLARSDDEGLRSRYLARHPDAALYAGFKDFHFYRLNMTAAHLVGGFGRIQWLTASELVPTPVAGLREAESEILEHMNGDHADAVQLYATRLLGLTGDAWRMTGVDSEGIDLRQGGTVARLPFDNPLAKVADVRPALVALVARARAA